jgi:hypothetical protein
MGFHAASVISDGQTAKSEFSVKVTNISFESNAEEYTKQRVDVIGRIPAHPAHAIEESVRNKSFTPIQRYDSLDSDDGDIYEKATFRLDRLTLHDNETPQSNAADSYVQSSAPSPAPAPDVTTCYHLPSSHSLGSEQRVGSPAPSLASSYASSAPSVASSHASSDAPSRFRSPRERFLVFIKILFRLLDQANEPEIRLRAKTIVAECTRRNRLGDPNFSPLMEAVERRLRGFVGEVLWRRALLLLRHFVAKRTERRDEQLL